ncbi:carbamoyl-phosphate synthase large subunit [Dethiobacter alkaliphilus]|uniref:Carbamoyl phosphate synthase large chain n=1 Tax=Dethiobacter alkaliphilus AHT 1 TaxID=555088 RepID=C0GFF0_DETAL|nr:carbamoyl-phosphate synthase large subunit [Dethiobacter alkaliphilus]EEG77910.1 carbamoyl-phosphate synthase, large subunit [Dethiobacter alkaliphilus AHT 1]
MPKRTDIEKILVIGSGPIVIGQACEFDYSGTQACKALREEGYKIVLVNSNPATIMTDPEMADAVYIEPLNTDILEMIIDKEKPDAILPTIGGQTALNLTVELAEKGILDKYRVELIGAGIDAIKKAEDRELFRAAIQKVGLDVPQSFAVSSLAEGLDVIGEIGFPAILRPAFTLGGTGGGIAYNIQEYREILEKGLDLSPTKQVLVEESVLGWKEFELEVMRDKKDNVVIICSIENFDPMGIHTGDSITVAPAQTLTDKEYQRMRDAAIAIIREIGVDTGGSNIQFGISPQDGRLVVIEMNPRVSRSSALASKATGFPIAKIAAKLAVGLTLDEIPNDITRETPASFEPVIDYVVVKAPRFAFEKFPEADATLTTQMKSVGEAMAIGRTFKEALNKAIRSLELDCFGFERQEADMMNIRSKLHIPNSERLLYIGEAFRRGLTIEEIHEITQIDPWFLYNIRQIVALEDKVACFADAGKTEALPPELLRKAKEYGLSDKRIGHLLGDSENAVRSRRKELGVLPVYKMVDTCAAEFRAYTPYFYSTYEKPYRSAGAQKDVTVCEAAPGEREKIIILGSGPNRIGQGIEFDYCCVHAVMACRDLGYEAVMVNCNPETVSTDYDTADRLYFEPLTAEDVMNIIELEKPRGVILQFGGQTPLKLAMTLWQAGVKILGTSPDSVDRAEDRKRFKELLDKLELKQPESVTAVSVEEALAAVQNIGYPVIVRPSYVLGGRAMEIIYSDDNLLDYMNRAMVASPEHPVLIDKYLEGAIEVDVDAVSDGTNTLIAGIMEHIEEAGIHSGDSACSLPPYSISSDIIEEIRVQTKALATELGVCGLMNIQYAVKNGDIYILEVNPRASRTIPFVSKVTGIPFAKLATRVISGHSLAGQGITDEVQIPHVAVKEAVFPFNKFSGVDVLLGPEMKSTGEVMGIDDDFGLAYAKSQAASNNIIPISGRIFISVKDQDKQPIAAIAARLQALGMKIVSTRGTAKYLNELGITTDVINKVAEGRPHVVDMIKNREVDFVINTVAGARARKDSLSIRRSALQYRVPYTTTVTGARAAVTAMEMLSQKNINIKPIQEYHASIRES